MKSKRSIRRRHIDLGVATLKSFRIIYGSVRRQLREVQQTCGISGSQLWMLHEVKRSQSIGISDLASKLSIHQSTCSQLVEKLVRAGLVRKVRQTADQRRVELKVTPKGERLLLRAPGPAEGVLPEAIAELTADQIRTLYRGLAYVIAALDIVDESAAERHIADL